MAVVGTAFLCAVSWTFARIHVEQDGPGWSPRVHLVDPPAGQICKSGEVLGPGQPLRLEATHLAGRGSTPGNRPVADHPAHRRVATQPIGIVQILVTSEPPEYPLRSKPPS